MCRVINIYVVRDCGLLLGQTVVEKTGTAVLAGKAVLAVRDVGASGSFGFYFSALGLGNLLSPDAFWPFYVRRSLSAIQRIGSANKCYSNKCYTKKCYTEKVLHPKKCYTVKCYTRQECYTNKRATAEYYLLNEEVHSPRVREDKLQQF